MSQNDSPILRNLGAVLLGIGVIALIVGGITVILYRQQFGGSLSGEHAQWAEFGDYVGGVVGSIFAFFGLIALLLTLWIQSRELRVSSAELRRSAEALSEQNKSIKLQSFENRFFNMISLHHEIVNGIDLRVKGEVKSSGRDCLRVFYERLVKEFAPALRGDNLNYKDGLLSGYANFYEKHAHELGHYFRNIYRILKFIEESDVPRKSEYSGILRAQLSNPELALLFYNGITVRGDKLKPLAEKYALFENLEPKQLARKDEDFKFYEAEAFGEHIDLFMG
ncbi:putative phage abortive infection protein [Halomonas sp. M5N1S17]|uniref:putative phage abortive infection protein n=1 Tax=Halomonas alkalisoli TaxID=2907158 RepID=UPI001F3FCEF9|nr:putative phage abortive infection protein [Halomonas alkalisoli]MCE9664818.1 putative phage abortive infection protein [Halomonas alkalisoli]